MPVTVTPVAAIATAERLEAGGVVAAPQSAAISSRLVATIAAIHVNAGDRVRTGAGLITLDARDITAHTGQAQASAVAADKALTHARAERSAAEAEHRVAAAWQKRIAMLHARNSATDQERDEADARLSVAAARLAGTEAGIEGADAQLASARAAVGVATATESFTTVRAPFDGLVTERLTDPGNLAAPGVPLLRLESDGARQVVVRVDEARAAYVHPGDQVTVVIDAAAAHAAEAYGLEAVVTEVARAVGADQRAFTVKVSLPPTVTARTGSFARVVFRGAPRQALLVPAHAIQRHGQVLSVYVVHDGVARLRLIRVGPSSSEGVEVLAGLEAGESIVVSPLARLVDGAAVTVGKLPTRPGGAS
ncbi:efflux RND transporter periplasmic adaptor subunit [Luteitalea pratensis]|nr:efflux RND transporter periplasmic adaptor subunit [Luteitalea pratensis]